MSKPNIAPTAELLTCLKESAAKPFEEALSLPAGMYRSDDILRLEVENLFRQDWICVGREEEIPEPGDYLTYDIVDYPVVVIRQQDGTIRSMANACLHRHTKILTGIRGEARRFSCPYHGWTYNSDGSLVGAPYMDQSPAFSCEGKGLPVLRTEIWESFIYVTLNPGAESISTRLKGLSRIVGNHEMKHYRTLVHDDELWDTNWKCLTENFIEGYHIFKIHKETFESTSPTTTNICYPGEKAYTYMTTDILEHSDFGRAYPSNLRLKGALRHTGFIFCIFPSHLIQLTPDILWYMSLQPHGHGQVKVRRGISAAPELLAVQEDKDKFRREVTSLFDRVNNEDKTAVSRVYQGSAVMPAQSPLCIYERCLHSFQNYLASRLCA